jgi:DNA-binding MarR family transcriptional regulator
VTETIEDTDAVDLLDALVQLSFAVTAVLTKAAAAHDLSLTQLRMLGVLRGREPKMAELAAFLGLDRSTVSGLIDRAERRGLARRTGSPDDGRSVRVSLTPAANRLAVDLVAEIGRSLAPMIDRLAQNDRRRLTALLARLLGPLPAA